MASVVISGFFPLSREHSSVFKGIPVPLFLILYSFIIYVSIIELSFNRL